jgi:hypothetical protein
MHQGKARPKLELGVSFTRRRLRLSVAHHGAPGAWRAPTKDTAVAQAKKK